METATDRPAAAGPSSDDLLQVAEKAPVTQLVNLILLEAVKRRASDIHFEPFESRLRLRYRVDGVLYEQPAPPKHMELALVSRLKVMARMDIAEKRLPQDGMARVRVGEREIDIRVSTVPVAEGERVVLRLLDRNSAFMPLSALGMSGSTLAAFEALITRPNGIVIVSGPTGSGKTTTLYAALGGMDARRKNIMTVEDPIEYQLPDIGQIQVKPKIGLTFASGLRHILRQDPDIVLVGETRDLETAEIAVRAALTGHLVFTTLHTNDAPGAILRLTDMGVEAHLLASCVRGILAQRLVRKLCPHCRQDTVLTAEQVAGRGRAAESAAGNKVWMPRGCPACLEGYSGRIGLFELLVVDAAMQDLVRSGRASGDALRRAAQTRGMVDLLADGMGKVLAGMTSLAEVASVV
jgi:general secretion pathway protein E